MISALRILMRKPHLLNLILEDQDVNREKLLKNYKLPNGLPKVALHSLCNKTDYVVSPYTFLEGGSLPTDYLLLRILAEKFSNCRYFEIGTWRGESAANVAQIASEVFSLNLSDEQMRESGKDEQYINLHGFFSRELKNVHHLKGDSSKFDFSAFQKTCDLIFIDGDHHYEAVKRDTQNAFSLRKNNESILVWHDYGMNTETPRWEVLRGILDGLPQSEHRHLYSVSNTLCAIYYPHQVNTLAYQYPQTPEHNFLLDITIKNLRE